MKKFFRPTISKAILTIILALAEFAGPIIYGRVAIITENGPEASNYLIGLLVNLLNYTATIIFYPVHLIFNFFVTKDFVVNSIANGTQYILFLFSCIFFLAILLEAYLISCVIFYIISTFTNKKSRLLVNS